MSEKINIKDSFLNNSPIIRGDNNSVAIQSSNDEFDWKLVQDELIQVIGKLSESSNEYVATKEALTCALNKNKEGLIKVFKKNSASFLTDIFKGVASGTLVRLILSMTGN